VTVGNGFAVIPCLQPQPFAARKMGMHTLERLMVPARELSRALGLALVACAPALAQQGEPIGSWWFLEMAGAPAPRHAIMTLSTQGSGVIAIQCAAGKSTVLVGLNRPEIQPRSRETSLTIELQLGTGERRPAQALRTSEDTIELDEQASTEILAQVGDAASFSIHLPNGPEPEITLVFRPVQTKQAITRLDQVCALR
jgi:hypothetical protein